MSSLSKDELRLQLRAARNEIDEANRDLAAQQLCHNVCNLSQFKHATNMAFYWPHDGEISTIPLLNAALSQDKNCFLPVLLLDAKQQLAFAAYNHDTSLVKNRYNISEPELGFSYLIDFAALELIFLPLVGFDNQGQRLGMGGGFYDATFANHLSHLKKEQRPQLIGLAYDCQQVARLPANSWDWRLDAVVTDRLIFNF